MIEKLPGYYKKSKVLADLYAILQTAINKTQADIDTADLRLFIMTTDVFDKHEADVGLSPNSENPDDRRAAVLARLQGGHVLTVEALKTLVTAYEPTGCSISEDYGNYTVYIAFDGRIGIPENMALLMAAIEEVKPAHIKIGCVYTENTWADLDRKFGRWENIVPYDTWDKIRYYYETWIYINDEGIPYIAERYNANAKVEFERGIGYARRL